MSKQITIPFHVTTWDAKPFDESGDDDLTLSRVTVRKSFDGEMKGESAGELLMCAAEGGAAGYTILDQFFVEIDGRSGTFVAIHCGFTDEMRAAGRIVPDSGTGGLKGIAGTLEFRSNENGKTIIFNYSFSD